MAVFLLYIIKSSCCLILFYLGYKALLSNDTFFRFNRMVLLTGMVACLLLPAVRLETRSPGIIHIPVMELERMMLEEEITASKASETTLSISPERKTSVSLTGLFFFILLAGSIVNISFVIRSHILLRRLIRDVEKIQQGKYRIIVCKGTIIPFSYGRYIVLSENDYRNNGTIILEHELAHCRKHHSLDLLFMELLILLYWFNPVVWLLKRELREIHEFQADTEVLKKGIDATTYQLLLVKKAVGSSSYTFANSFNHSKLKKRITMMLKKKSSNWARLKLALLVPVAVVTVHAFARPEVNRQLENIIQSEDKVIPYQNKEYTSEFYEAELNEYITKLNGDASATVGNKREFLKDKTNKLVINVDKRNGYFSIFGSLEIKTAKTLMSNNTGLFLVEPASEFTDYLKKVFFEDNTDTKPVLILMQFENAVTEEIKTKLLNTIGIFFAENGEGLNKKGQPILLMEIPAKDKK